MIKYPFEVPDPKLATAVSAQSLSVHAIIVTFVVGKAHGRDWTSSVAP